MAEPMTTAPMFPIMGGPNIPWALIAPYEAQAQKNHYQTLKRLAERGGLSICEAMAVMSSVSYEKRPIAKPSVEDWLDFIAERKARSERRASLSPAPTSGSDADASLHSESGERITRKDLNNAYRKGAEDGRLATRLIDGLFPAPSETGASVGVKAWQDVFNERRRQVEAEGWTPEHDNAHANGEMALAGGWYALNSVYCGPECIGDVSDGMCEASKLFAPRHRHGAYQWPWDRSWWKPSTPRRDLVKAGALILAEIERIDRAALASATDAEGR